MLRKVASATEKQTMNRDPQKTSSGLVSQGAVIMANGKLLATRDVSRNMRCIHLLSQPPWQQNKWDNLSPVGLGRLCLLRG